MNTNTKKKITQHKKMKQCSSNPKFNTIKNIIMGMVKEGGRVGCDNNVNKLEYEGRVVRDNSGE